jgi:tetratricopeptide (TPR) repeat protein
MRRKILLGLILAAFSLSVASASDNPEKLSKKAAFRQGDSLVRAGQYQEALTIWRRLEQQYPEDTEVLLRIGVAESMLENHEKSEAAFVRAMEIDPEDATVIYNFALMKLRLGDEEAAEKYLRETLKVFPNYPEANYHLGLIAERRGDTETAQELYIKEMNENPNMPRAWAGFFRLKDEEKDEDEDKDADRWMLNFAAICAVLTIALVILVRKPRIRRHEQN